MVLLGAEGGGRSAVRPMEGGPQSPPRLSPRAGSRSPSPRRVQRWRQPEEPAFEGPRARGASPLALRPSSAGRRSPSPRGSPGSPTLAWSGRDQPHSPVAGGSSYRLGEGLQDDEQEEFSRALVGVREEWLALREDLTLAGQREGAAIAWFVRKLQRARLRTAWSDWLAGLDAHASAKATQELSAKLSSVSAELYHTRAVHRLDGGRGAADAAEILLHGAVLPGGGVVAEFGAMACRLHRASASWVGAPVAAVEGNRTIEGLAMRLAREEEQATTPLKCAVAVLGVGTAGRCAERALAAQRRGARAVVFVDAETNRPAALPVSWTVRCVRPVGVTRELEVAPDSLIIGSHMEGALVEVFERRPTLSGQARLRTADGWISARSRDGKQLVESILSDDSDDEDERGAVGVLGPLGGIDALAIPVVCIGAQGAEQLLAAMGANQNPNHGLEHDGMSLSHRKSGRRGWQEPGAVVSITFGSEKAWRWQCAHQELRLSHGSSGGEAFRQRQRKANERYGMLERRFQRLQQKQMAQVMVRWMLGARFRAWREWACGLASRRRTLRKVGGRLAHHTVARAFSRWVERTVGKRWRQDELTTLRARLERSRDASVEKIVRRMRSAELATVFERWRGVTTENQRNRQVIERALLRLAQSTLFRAFNKWKDMARRKITAAQMILRWRHRELVVAWKRWREFVLTRLSRDARRRHQHRFDGAAKREHYRSGRQLGGSVVGRWQHRGLARCFESWKAYTSQRRRWVHVGSGAVNRMLDREVGKAFMRWAAYTARMRHVVMTLENTTLMWLSNPGLRRAFNRWRSWFMQRTLLRRAVYNFFDGGCLIRCFWRWRRRAAVATAKKLWRQRERVRESYDAEVAIIRHDDALGRQYRSVHASPGRSRSRSRSHSRSRSRSRSRGRARSRSRGRSRSRSRGPSRSRSRGPSRSRPSSPNSWRSVDDEEEDDLLFQDVLYSDSDALSSIGSVSTGGWTSWELEHWHGGRPVLARAFYGWRERCHLRELRFISAESRKLRQRLLQSARQRLWRWRLAQVLRSWCEATRLLTWGRLRLARAVDRLGMLRLHWAMAAWHVAAGCSTAEIDAVERIGGAERAVAVVTKLQSLLYPPPPTPADVADAERTVEENFRRLAKQREGSWWSNLLGGNKPNAAEYVHPPRQINPTAGLAEGEIVLGRAVIPAGRIGVSEARAAAAARAEAYAARAGGGTLPTGFSAVRPPTPAEVAEAEKSFQLAVHRQRPGQRRRAPPTDKKRVAQFLPLSPSDEQSLAPLSTSAAVDMLSLLLCERLGDALATLLQGIRDARQNELQERTAGKENTDLQHQGFARNGGRAADSGVTALCRLVEDLPLLPLLPALDALHAALGRQITETNRTLDRLRSGGLAHPPRAPPRLHPVLLAGIPENVDSRHLQQHLRQMHDIDPAHQSHIHAHESRFADSIATPTQVSVDVRSTNATPASLAAAAGSPTTASIREEVAQRRAAMLSRAR